MTKKINKKEELTLSQYKGQKILIVDDDHFICTVLEKCLENTGLDFEIYSDSTKVLDILAQKEFDCILSDIYMPNASGLDVLAAVQIHQAETPVIIMTGKPTLDNTIQALRLGAFDFITKPFNTDTVFLTLERALRYRKVLVENRNYHSHLEELVDQRTKELQDILLQSVQSLTHALEARDPYTQGHGYNVSYLVIKMAKKLGIPENVFLDLKLAAELHDIGKIGVPDSILLKPGKLTDGEFDKMKEHVSIGYKILSPIPSLKNVSRYVHEHHERMDGKGYPRGLKGDEIHYNSQLLVVSEVCDALAAKRCYKPPWPKGDIIQYFEENSDTAFHPEISAALISVLKQDGDDILKRLRGSNF